MAAPTNAASVKKALANSEPSTHGTKRINVSLTDMKVEINIFDTLQFLFVAHILKALPAIGA
jgi:hypothetical protein